MVIAFAVIDGLFIAIFVDLLTCCLHLIGSDCSGVCITGGCYVEITC